LTRFVPLWAALVLAAALAIAGGPAATPARAEQGSTVTPWIELELETIAAQRLNPARAARALAYVSRAMYAAALSGDAGRDDAVAGAASVVVGYLHPEAAGKVDVLASQLADPETRAFSRGRAVGQSLLARARSDGSDAAWTGTAPPGEQYWVPYAARVRVPAA